MPVALSTLATALRSISPNALFSGATYGWRKRWTEARWADDGRRRRGRDLAAALGRALRGPRPAWPKRWTTPGRVAYVEPLAQGARLRCERATIEISFLATDLVRVSYETDAFGARAALPYAIDKPLATWDPPPTAVAQRPNTYYLQTTDLVIAVGLSTARLAIATPGGTLLRADLDVGWAPSGVCRHRVALAPEERVFGLGERATDLNRRGACHVLWNVDPAGYADGDDPINLNVPVTVGIVPGAKGAGYLAFYDNPHYAEFDIGSTVENIAEHRFAGGELRYYLATGRPPALMERYTELTGRHSLQPLWMLGYHQSRWSYDSEARVRKLVADLRRHDVPCDSIHLDIDHMDGFRCFTWNGANFPDPAGLAADLRDAGLRLISIIDPGIRRDPAYHVYRAGMEGGHFVTRPDGEVFHAPVWPGNSAFPDFTSAATRAWWGRLYEPLLAAGLAGFWNDMNEPSAFAQAGDRTLPLNLRHALEGRGGTHAAAHNHYGMLMARATREGLEALQPDQRPVVITRSGWAGIQRYATSWTADNESTWDALRLTIPMVLGLGLSGIGFTGPDIGGFFGEADGELFTRWLQMAAFMPFFRAHTAKGFPDQEPWSYGEPYLTVNRRFIQLRYELLPYLYTALWQMCTRGWPMVRPLAWDDPGDSALWDVDDAFLCGDHLLVAPITAPGESTRHVPLPSGAWYDFWTNRRHVGGTSVEPFAPLETIPLFVRGGSVLTLGEVGPSVDQRPDKFLRLWVYPLGRPGMATTRLYEDAGGGMAYKNGNRRTSRFRLEQDQLEISISWQRAGRYRPPYEHIALTLCGLQHGPRSVRADGDKFGVLEVDPVRHTALLGVPLFNRLEIKL